MDIKRMDELSVMITNLKKAAEELMGTWRTHADGCEHVELSDDLDEFERGCTHSDPGCASAYACTHDNCPLLCINKEKK